MSLLAIGVVIKTQNQKRKQNMRENNRRAKKERGHAILLVRRVQSRDRVRERFELLI